MLGRTVHDDSIAAVSAGANYLVFIVRGTTGGRDLRAVPGEHVLDTNWKQPKFNGNPRQIEGLWMLVRMYHRFRELIFSGEDDGLGHLFRDIVRKWDAESVRCTRVLISWSFYSMMERIHWR